MIDVQFIRDNPDKVKKAVSSKQLDPSMVDKALELDGKWKDILGAVEELRKERNEIARQRTPDAASRGQKIKQELKKLEGELLEVTDKYQKALFEIPNIPASDVGEGKDENANEVIRKWGEPGKFDFEPKDHLEIGEGLGMIDVKRASKVSGTRFAYLKKDAVLLEFALVGFALETLIKEGFIPVVPPVLINKGMMRKMGYMEHGGEEDMYVLEKDNLVLVGTSEQSIGPMHEGEVFDSEDLPLRYVGFSPCFRRESGSYGKDTRGILRLHQFEKVEMFSYSKEEESDKEHEYLLSLEEKLFQALNIPYRVVKMCTGDLGAPAARKYDLEAWMPGQDKYREVTSASNCTDFQSRRLNIKYRKGSETSFVHTLNGTAFAIGRTIIAILENYQKKDGSVEVPEVLRKWVGKDRLSPK